MGDLKYAPPHGKLTPVARNGAAVGRYIAFETALVEAEEGVYAAVDGASVPAAVGCYGGWRLARVGVVGERAVIT